MIAPTSANLTMVENGKLALEAVLSSKFDIVLMDIEMPEMDGMQAMRAIAKVDSTLPVIALTANVIPEFVEDYLNKGFTDHIGKPIDKNLLFIILAKYLS